MKNLIKKFGQIPTLLYGLAMVVANIGLVMAGMIDAIIPVSAIIIGVGVLGVLSRYVK